MNNKAQYYIEKLGLIRHPEGGYYNEIYRCAEIYYADRLPGRYSGERNFSTTIYFLLEGRQYSAFHKLNSDEGWHHLDGDTVKIYILDQSSKLSEIMLGKNLESGETPHIVINSGDWFAAEMINKESFALITCTVSPGFEFDDFTMGKGDYLLKNYPMHQDIVCRFTKP